MNISNIRHGEWMRGKGMDNFLSARRSGEKKLWVHTNMTNEKWEKTIQVDMQSLKGKRPDL